MKNVTNIFLPALLLICVAIFSICLGVIFKYSNSFDQNTAAIIGNTVASNNFRVYAKIVAIVNVNGKHLINSSMPPLEGWSVKKGNIIYLTATGKWTDSVGKPLYGPDGIVNGPIIKETGFNKGALVILIKYDNGEQQWFKVGRNLRIPIKKDGKIFFAFNNIGGDFLISDGDGYVNVTISGLKDPYLNFTSPDFSEEWFEGSSYKIKWNSIGGKFPSKQKGDIYLYRFFEDTMGSLLDPHKQKISLAEVVKENVMIADGNYNWKIPSLFHEEGSYLDSYVLVFETYYNKKTIEFYSNVFTIAKPHCHLTSPSSKGDANNPLLILGSPYNIKWVAHGDFPITTRVILELSHQEQDPAVTDHTQLIDVTQRITDDLVMPMGSYKWTVPPDLSTNKTYYIEMYATNDNILGEIEDVHKIKLVCRDHSVGLGVVAPPAPSIKIISPNPANKEILNKGLPYKISWNVLGAFPADQMVRINISSYFDSGDPATTGYYRVNAYEIALSKGYYEWTVPASYTGEYEIMLETALGNTVVSSISLFTIK